MGKVISGIFGTLVIGGIVLFLLFHFGLLSWGGGNGDGNADEKMGAVAEDNQAAADEPKEITITIVVTQDQYLIDEQQVTLTQIKEKVTDKSATIKVILEDNYASAKAWDDIKINLEKWGIIPIEQ